jgi:hypothetical protein
VAVFLTEATRCLRSRMGFSGRPVSAHFEAVGGQLTPALKGSVGDHRRCRLDRPSRVNVGVRDPIKTGVGGSGGTLR